MEFKCRNNNSLKKEDFQQFLLSQISKDYYKVDVRNPDIVVLIEISNDLLSFSIIDNYYQNKCYNLMELANNNPKIVKKDTSKIEENKIILETPHILEKVQEKENLVKEKQEVDDDNEEEIQLI
jgi:hypothetical protein